MKSVVCNVFGMAAIVACLALVLTRPAGAGDQEKQETKEVTTTTVITTDASETAEVDVAQALHKALQQRLEGLPGEIQAKIQQKLQEAGKTARVKVAIQPQADVESAKDAEGTTTRQSKTLAITVVGDGAADVTHDAKEVEVRTLIVGDSLKETEAGKPLVVALEGGQLTVNGKAMGVPLFKQDGQQEIVLQVQAADGKDGPKVHRRKLIVMGKDGQPKELSRDQELSLKIDVDDESPSDEPSASKTVTAKAHAFVIQKQEDGAAKHLTVTVDPQKREGKRHMLLVGPQADQKVSAHVIRVDAAQADKSHAEVSKRLKSIESELKKIRKLLEKMQQADKP